MRPPAPSRIVPLDGVRGIAVMGILLMNIQAFALPIAAYGNPVALGPPGGAGIALWALEFVAFDGKMRALFSALFGASLLLVTERAAAAGESPARVHYARMATLLGFGLLHACLLWDGDILTLYALVGMVAFAFRRLPVERLLVAAGLCLLFAFVTTALHYQALGALGEAVAAGRAAPAEAAGWRAMLDQIGPPTPAALADDLALHRGGWRRLAAWLADEERATLPQTLLLDGPETLGLMLLGMAGLRSGFLGGKWARVRYRAVARWALGCCLPPLALIALRLWSTGFPPLATAAWAGLTMPLRWGVAIGYAAVLVPWFAGATGGLKRRIAAAGRVAFSNYLGTSLAMTALFDGWGLGLYGRIDRVALLPVVAATWAAMLAWSPWWLARFRYGPLEWLWRGLARGRLPPLRGSAIASKSR